MSAQLPPAAKPNGVVPEGVQRSAEARPSAGVVHRPEVFPDELQRQARAVSLRGEDQPGVQESLADRPALASDTTAAAGQAKQQPKTSTILDVGGSAELGNTGAATKSASLSGGFFTPKATSQPRSSGNTQWIGNVEVPRWVMRLSNFLNTGPMAHAAELAPSPLPGASPPYSTPPGGHPFRLRSPTRVRAIPPAPTPPSSSSVPAEAIQAEVQRQLQGVVGQLREYEERNHRLQLELDDVRARLEQERSRSVNVEATTLPPRGLLGDLSQAQLDPGVLTGFPEPERDPALLPGGACGQCGPDVPQGGVGLSSISGVWGPGGYRGSDGGLPVLPTEDTAQHLPDQGERSASLRDWLMGRPRSQSPPPRPQKDQADSPVLEALARGVQQLQELQAQALTKATAGTTAEVVKPGTVSLMTMPEGKDGAESALTFQDWLEVSSSVMADISENSGTWWHGIMVQVEATYEKWLMASPLERLAVEPPDSEEWSTGRWSRVNARGASMILASMPDNLKADIVARRSTQSSVRMMFRAYTFYQPGGGAERQDVLKRLQSPSDYASGDSVDQVLQVVRSWPRWLERCKKVHMTPPDASVLARGLTTLTERHISSSTDASFRTSMLRASLRLDARPTVQQVQSYQKHLQAELEVLAASGAAQTSAAPKLKAVDTVLQPKARDSGGKGGTTSEVCRYFAKATGCKRGGRCSYAHTMAGMDKETRARKCLRCGSEAHRQKDCLVGRPGSKGTGGAAKDTTGTKGPGAGSGSQHSTVATVSTVGASSTSSQETVQGVPWTLEALVQAAQQIVQGPPVDGGGDSSPEKTKPSVRVLHLRDLRVCAAKASTTALVDSGATHSLRTARTQEEWEQAEEVVVQLAGSHQLTMRMSETGTLLMPYKNQVTDALGPGPLRPQTIVPMGQLIKTLGYTMTWTPKECYLTSSDGEQIPLQTDGGCPEIRELEALALIARLEDKKLDLLNNQVLTTKDKLQVSAMAMDRPWTSYLYDYVSTGSFESGLRAVRDAPFFADVPGECLSELVPSAGLWSGWSICKEIGFLTRSQKRKLWSAKRWCVHLFSGEKGHWEFFKLDQGDTTVLELDLARCSGQDLLRSEVWRLLLWGAREGKIDVIFGGPPGRAMQHAKGGTRNTKSLKLIARMMWLFEVAQIGREINGKGVTKDRDVGFIMEYPEGIPQEERDLRDRRLQEEDEGHRSADMRGEPATWDQTNAYWENVQRPRWEELVGKPTVDAKGGFWETRMWKAFQREAQLRTVSFDQGAMGGVTRNRTTLGTNLNSLLSLDGVRVPEGDPLPDRGEGDHVWAPGLVRAMVVAMSFWDRDPLCAPRLFAMTPSQWKHHVNTNHAQYRKDCAACVMSRGVGRQHRRVHHPEAYVLTADVAGPLSPGLDATSKGTMGKSLKYLLVAKYLVPKAFIEDYAGRPPPEDDGAGVLPDLPGASNKGKDPKPLVDTLLDEDKGSDEQVVKDMAAIEVMTIPTISGLLLDGEPGDELDYDYSEPDQDDKEEEEYVTGEVDVVMKEGDCEAPELTYLAFGTALPNNQAITVRRALQDVVLYLQMHGLPVYRFHADKGEFYNHHFRSWLRDQGVYGTWSEPGTPQSNGHAESTVRWLKDRTRTLLRASSLPTRLWPVAAAMAAAEQRSKVLGWKSSIVAPFGAPVHLRKKAFDKHGPLRREHGLESKWMVGKYVGLSTIVHNGHLVYVPATEGESEKFLHTLHVRADLVDPGAPDLAVSLDPGPKPRRRVQGKTSSGSVEMKAVTRVPEETYKIATMETERLLQEWDLDEACSLVVSLARSGFFADKKFGAYRHGGAVGQMTGLVEYPALTRLLNRIMVEVCPEATFTSLLVSCNTPKAMHRDVNNDYNTMNHVLPLVVPESGGGLWIELKEGDVVCGQIEQRSATTGQLYGQLRLLQEREVIEFCPKRFHEVMDWVGERIVLIAYTPDCLGKLPQEDLLALHQHDFPIPVSQLPEYNGNLDVERPFARVSAMSPCLGEPAGDEEPADQAKQVSDGWEMYLDLKPGLVKIAEETIPGDLPWMQKAEVGFTRNIEAVLQNLTGPLDVVHNVSPQEVMPHLEAWKPAIMKEVQGISVAIEKLIPGTESRRRWLNNPRAQRLPMKFVFTIKPNENAKTDQPETWYKRKARLVICGNLARHEDASLYAETAPAEAVRMALTVAVKNQWLIAIMDVVAAFLKTPLGRLETDPVVIAQPPRLLEAMGLVESFELWGLVRALYGLRESPMLWTHYRDATLKTMRAPVGLKWKQGRAITSWWTLRDSQERVCAIVVVYVDDFLVCGPKEVVTEVAKIIQEVWDTSELNFLGPQNAVRFLGMELQRETETSEVITMFQQGYIQELLRAHEVKSTQQDRVPITKDLAYSPEQPERPEESEVRRAQQLTGEALWVSQRTRPDLSYTTSIMASMCTRNPSQVIAIGGKVLGYLQRTMFFGLRVQWENKGLVMFCDAAYAPQGDRSHGGWVVTYGGTPIVWRSGKQQMVTLSTAEAELLSMIDGAVAMKGVESLLADVGETVEDREIASDSMAALSISTGSSSWRTRHLRIKANWLQEQLTYGYMKASHCPGEFQPADLLTKALSSARTTTLLLLWKVSDQASRMSPAISAIQGSSRLIVALVCCLLIVSVQAAEGDPSLPRGTGLQVDRDLIGTFMMGLMILGALLLWEGLKWLCSEVYNEYTPGASARKLRKLKKLRDATAEAIERELRRMDYEGRRGEEYNSSRSRTTTGRSSSIQQHSRKRTPSPPTSQRACSPLRESSLRLPSPPRRESVSTMSPNTWSPGNNAGHPVSELQRVCEDMCKLMTCESLKEGLRTEGLAVSGLKDDQARRLGARLVELSHEASSPTIRQWKYVLWLWRNKNISGRHTIRYCEVNHKERISALIAQWNRL